MAPNIGQEAKPEPHHHPTPDAGNLRFKPSRTTAAQLPAKGRNCRDEIDGTLHRLAMSQSAAGGQSR